MKSSKIIQEYQKQDPYGEFLDENENEKDKLFEALK
jgi:hypothetical protein